MKPRSRVLNRIVVAVALMFPVVLVLGRLPTAQGEICGLPDGCHLYSNGYTFDTASGIEGQWHDNNMYLSGADYSANGHINNEMWIQTPNGGYVEMGLFNGILPYPFGNPCNCVAYQQFWADTTDSGYQYNHWIADLTPDGSNHVYEILNQYGTNMWDICVDYVCNNTSTVETASVGTYEPIGIELAQGYNGPDIDTSSHADNFDNYWQTLENGSWVYPAVTPYIDHQCLADLSNQGYCLNGLPEQNGEWSDSKP